MKPIIQEIKVGKVSINAKEMVIVDEKGETYPALKTRGVLRGRFRPMSFKTLEKRINRMAVQARKDLEKIIIKILEENKS